MEKEIFISHQSSDKDFAEIIVEFLTSCGINRQAIFCSSIAGNGVSKKIPNEIMAALKATSKNLLMRNPNCIRA